MVRNCGLRKLDPLLNVGGAQTKRFARLWPGRGLFANGLVTRRPRFIFFQRL